MLSKLSVLLVILATSYAASALELKPVPTADVPALPDVDTQAIPCDKIVTRLSDFSKRLSSHENSLTAFLGQVNQAYKDWYQQLGPLENTTQTIPTGTFSPLQAAADDTDRVVNDAFDNTDKIATEMQQIIDAAKACSIKDPAAPLVFPRVPRQL